MDAAVGRLINKFKIKKRRDVLFFHDIFIQYIVECGKRHNTEMQKVGRDWMALYFKLLVPPVVKKLPPIIVLNTIMRKIWANLGLIDYYQIDKHDDKIEVITKNEVTTKRAGKNRLMIGFHEGILSILFNSRVECVKSLQEKKICRYAFKITKEPFNIRSKNKIKYDLLNDSPQTEGISLKDALKNRIFELKEKNKIYFRGKEVYPIENTLFHLLSNEYVLSDRIPFISYEFFKDIIEPYSSAEKKLKLLKTLLHAMGWGIIKIIMQQNEILIEINYPPYGLQSEDDNWDFLIRTILGYLWLLDKRFKISEIQKINNTLKIRYSK
jgi:hypothetical protein